MSIIGSFAGFCVEYLDELCRTTRKKGLRHGWAFTHCCWRDFYVHQREKRPQARVECPMCGWQGYDFRPLNAGWFVVPRVMCPRCESQERHRMLHLYLTRHCPEFFEQEGAVIHFGPEIHVQRLIDSNPRLVCFSTDIEWGMIECPEGLVFRSDLQHIPIPDRSVDVVFCLHILEHVADDRLGIRELHRILRPGGMAFIMVPFMMGWKKTREFGKPEPIWFDHVRGYAPTDFDERLDCFDYERISPETFLSPEERRRYAIPDSQIIFKCAKV